jgi:hypothetical protein
MPTVTHRTCTPVRTLFRTPRPLLTPLMLAALGIAGTVRAADVTTGDGAAALLGRIERLEASNRALSSEVSQLREARGETWLTEARAADIRAIVEDVLADSGTRTSLQANELTAGWDDGFFMQSVDGRFRLQVGGLVQARYVYSYIPDGLSGVNVASSPIADNVESRSGFDFPNTQLDFKGHVFGEEFTYRVRGQFSNQGEAVIGSGPLSNLGSASGTFRLLDAWLRAEVSDGIAIRVGQFKLPFAREQLVDSGHQLAVGRSTIVDHLGVGYSQGLEAQFVSDDIRVLVAISNGGTDNLFGVLKAAGSEPLNSDWASDQMDWAGTARVEWKLAGRWSQFNTMTSPPGDEFAFLLGVAAHLQEGDPDTGTGPNFNNPNRWYTFTADASAMYGGATLFGSFTYSYTDSGSAYIQGGSGFGSPTVFDIGVTDAWGAVLQGSYYFDPKWEAFARMEIGEGDVPNIANITSPGGAASLENGNMFSVLTVGFNYYIDGEDLKFTSDVGFALDAVDGIWASNANGWRAAAEQSEVVFRMQLQMGF